MRKRRRGSLGSLVLLMLGSRLLVAATPIGRQEIRIAAPRLAVDQKTGMATYSGGATVTRGTTVMTCEQLQVNYDKSRRIRSVTAVGKVLASDTTLSASGSQAVFDNETGVITLTGKPSLVQRQEGSVRTVDGETVTFSPDTHLATVSVARTRLSDNGKQLGEVAIDADTLTVDSKSNSALWKGHVVATRKTLTLKANEMTAFGRPGGTVQRLIASGNVEAFDGDKWASGRRAVYEASTATLVLLGAPSARVGQNRLKGTKVTFLVDKNLIDVENATTVLQVQ
jgi:lipopolysaccharide export system protein LptA